MKINGKDIILTILVILVLVGIVWVKSSRPEGTNSLAEFQNGKVWVYRVVDGKNTCYVTVGKLHGYTVAINCVKE